MIRSLKTSALSVSMSLILVATFAGTAMAGTTSGTLTGNDVNVRANPSTSAKVVAITHKSDKVTVYSLTDKWYKVKLTNGYNGYIYSSYLSTSAATAAAKTTQPKQLYINGNNVNVRSSNSTSSSIIANLNRGTAVNYISQSGSWYKVQLSNGKVGWVYGQYISSSVTSTATTTTAVKTTQPTKMYINGDNVNVRSSNSTSSSIIANLNRNTTVNYISQSGSWYKVQLSNGKIGWVYGQYISGTVTSAPKAAAPTASRGSLDRSRAVDLINFAENYIGTPYVYGGSSPSGFDCSGLVYYVYGHFGLSIPRTADAQANSGTKVSKSALQPGDVVCFATGSGSGVTHSGIYIGNGQFIHSSSGGGHVMINSLSSGYYADTFVTASRYLK